MSLDTALGTALGAVLSLTLFAFSYRQTVGARRERIRSANGEMRRVLVRRFVGDIDQSSLQDLERYVEGKAREHQVNRSGLLSVEELLTDVYAQIFEDDLLDTPRREQSADRVRELLDRLDREPEEELWPVTLAEEKVVERRRGLLAVLAGSTTLIGSLAALLPAIGGDLNGGAYATAVAASLVAIGALATVFRLRDEGDPDQARDSALQRAAHLERTVERMLRRYDGSRPVGPDRGLDFVVGQNGKRVGIELKSWSRPIARANLGRAMKNAAEAGRRAGVDEVLIVTPGPPPSSYREIAAENVRVIGVDELSAILNRHAA